MITAEQFNQRGAKNLPGHLGIVITHLEKGSVRAKLPFAEYLMAPNGYLHAGAVVSLADSCCGAGCVVSLPEGAVGFTTIELKSNHLSTTRSGLIECVANSVHLGKTRQVWDATVTGAEAGKVIALFRCTQLVLYAK